jgi:UDP-N-acetylmuramate dehydrogenase
VRERVPLLGFTTLRVGGPARWYLEAASIADVELAHQFCLARGVPLVVLGGGSNVVIADEGYAGLVLSMKVMGVDLTERSEETTATVGAGEEWDRLVATLVARGLSGVECLSGIPGTVGGTPIQNVGAYGQEVASSVTRVVAFDRDEGRMRAFTAAECGFSYRMSRFKGREAKRFIVCGVTFGLRRGGPTMTYPDLLAEIARLGVASPGVADVREAVLTVRRRKGMVLDDSDPDTRSVGSFFMNPVVGRDVRDRIATQCGQSPPGFVVSDEQVKIPAAWLIERAGFHKGAGQGPVGLSTKHPLAIVNRGDATTRDVLRFGVQVKRAVLDWCGIWLRPEPVFIGLDDDGDVAFLQKGA